MLGGEPRHAPRVRPRDLRVLPRQRRLPAAGRRAGRGRAGGAVQSQEGRRVVSEARGRLLPPGGWSEHVRPRLRGLLRQAAAQVRPHPGDLSRRRAPGLRVVSPGGPAVDQGQAVPRVGAAPRPGLRRAGPVRRASRVPRGERVLPVAVRGGGDSHDGRRGRMGDRRLRGRARRRDRTAQGAALARLARPPLLGVHLPPRLQGEFRRVQGDGSRTLWRAEVRGSDLSRAGGPARRRVVHAQSGVLQLPHRPHDDQRRVRPAVRRAGARSGD